MSIVRSGAIASVLDNDWFVVRANGAGCGNDLDLGLTLSGGDASTYAAFDVHTDLAEFVNAGSLQLVAGTDYTSGSDIYVRVHPSGVAPYGGYSLSVHL
jgi:hypothetical protein